MWPKGMEDLDAFSAREVKSSSREKRKRQVFLCRRTVRVNVGGKPIPARFLKIEGRGTLIGAKDQKERGIDRRIGRWSERSSTSQEQERTREEGAKEMSGEERPPEERWRRVGVSESLRGRRSEEMIQLNTSSLWGSDIPLESQRG